MPVFACTMPILLLSIFVFISYWTLTVLQLGGFANDPGVGWHLLTGDWIIRRGEVPLFDPFLASVAPRRWIADQWLSDLIFAGMLRLADGQRGMAALYAALTGLFLFTFSAIVFGAVVRSSGSPLLAGVSAFIALKLASVQFVLRPVVFGIGFFSLTALLVWRIIDRVRNVQTLRVVDVAPLIPLTVLWANMHPSFSLGILFLGLAIVGLVVDTMIIDQKSPQIRTFLALGAAFLLMLAASLVNPNGVGLLRQIVSLVGSDFFMNLNEEWRPLNVRSPDGKNFLLSIGVVLVGVCPAVRKRDQNYVTEPLLVSFFALSALSSVRFLPFYAISSAPLFAKGLSRLVLWEPLVRIPLYRRVGALAVTIDGRAMRQMRAYGGMVLIVSLFPFFSACFSGTVYPFSGPFEQSRAQFPYEAAEALHTIISQEGLLDPIAVCATADWGGFLALHGRGRFKPIIDDRNSLLGEAFYKDYFSSVSVGGDVNGFLKRTSARFLLLRDTEPLAIYLHDTGRLPERWRGRDSVLFEAQN